MQCVICHSTSLTATHNHIRWDVPVHTCQSCGHAYVYDRPDEDDTTKKYHSNKRRAVWYANCLRVRPIQSVLDIGPSPDFAMLQLLQQQRPEVKKYYYDIRKLKAPGFIKKHNLEAPRVSVLTALHVLEHFANPHDLIDLITKLADYFMIEVPNCDEEKFRLSSSITTHYSFFTSSSLKRLMNMHGIKCKFGLSKYPHKPTDRAQLMAWTLPPKKK